MLDPAGEFILQCRQTFLEIFAFVAIEFIAFATTALEFLPIKNLNIPAAASDDAFTFQPPDVVRNIGTLRAEHSSEKFLRDFQRINVKLVLTDEQPTRQPHFKRMKSIAGDILDQLRKIKIMIKENHLPEMLASVKLAFYRNDINAEGASGIKSHRVVSKYFSTEKQSHTENAFRINRSDLHRSAAFHN